MPVTVNESEIRRLVRFYREAVKGIGRDFLHEFDFEAPKVTIGVNKVIGALGILEVRTQRWAKRNLDGLYRTAVRSTREKLRALGKTQRRSRRKVFGRLHEQTIQSLVYGAEYGFLTKVGLALSEVKNRLRSVQEQARIMKLKDLLFDETIARVGLFSGQSVQVVKDNLYQEIMQLKNLVMAKTTPQALRMSNENIVQSIAALPFIKISDRRARKGFRHMRLDHYVEMLARTQASRAANLARRYGALEFDVELVQIVRRGSPKNDARALYLGKVFALTEKAADTYGVPHVNELPGGGPPFHPNCQYNEVPFVPERKPKRERSVALSPPPAWTLNRTYAEVQQLFQRRRSKR